MDRAQVVHVLVLSFGGFAQAHSLTFGGGGLAWFKLVGSSFFPPVGLLAGCFNKPSQWQSVSHPLSQSHSSLPTLPCLTSQTHGVTRRGRRREKAVGPN